MAKKLNAQRKKGVDFLLEAESESRRRGSDDRAWLGHVLRATELYGFGSALLQPISPTEEPDLLEMWRRVGNSIVAATEKLEDALFGKM